MVSISRTKQRRFLSTLAGVRLFLGVIAVCLIWSSLHSGHEDPDVKAWMNDASSRPDLGNDAPPVDNHKSKTQQAESQKTIVKEREKHPKSGEAPENEAAIASPAQKRVKSQNGKEAAKRNGDPATGKESKKETGSEPKNDTTVGHSPKATIAYAWTLAKCADFQSSTEGMIDAALVLKHSVHKTSFRSGVSKYDYQMYVLVHPKAERCTKVLEDAGYKILVLEPPVDKNEIKGKYLRQKVDREWCCGSDEFIKLYSFTLFDHPIVVHVDIDFAFFQPMDEIYDAMLDTGPAREAALDKIVTQYSIPKDQFPADIEAFLTRDYQQLIPGDKRSLFQAGFMVVRPNQQVFDDVIKVVLEGNFVAGWNATSGWGGLGYAGKVGAMAMQGLMAYFYDIVRPGVSVELHGCHYNWMGGDILYRGVPTFYPRQFPHLVGKCRNGDETCEDCQKTSFSEIKSVHFTNCRKPWNCIGIKWEKGQDKKAQGIDERNSNFDKCMEIVSHWHELRKDMEDKVMLKSNNSTLGDMWRAGDFKKDFFLGHCHENGQAGYIPLSHGVPPKLFAQIYT